MRTGFLLTMSLCLVGLNCSSSSRPMGGTGGGEEETGGSASGGSSGSKTGGSGGARTGGSGGGGSTGSTGGSMGTGGSTGGSTGTGGSTSTGGGGGSATADAGADGPPSAGSGGCAGVEALFCEDFEAQTAGQKPVGKFTVKGAVTVDATKSFSGKQAGYIHLNNPGGDTAAQLVFQGAPLFPTLAKGIFGRAMVYMNAVPGCCSTSNRIHWDLTTAKAGGTEYTLGSMYGNFMPVYQPGDDSVDTQTRWPEKKWACIQWEFRGTGNFLDVKVDGVRAAPGIPVTKWRAAMWSYLDFGWINFQPSSIPVDMWFDDLALGEKEIPCPAPKP